jgi:hypothetical protein
MYHLDAGIDMYYVDVVWVEAFIGNKKNVRFLWT